MCSKCYVYIVTKHFNLTNGVTISKNLANFLYKTEIVFLEQFMNDLLGLKIIYLDNIPYHYKSPNTSIKLKITQ